MRQRDLIGCALLAGCLLAGCGGATADPSSPRAAVSAFDSDVSSQHYAAACALLGPTPQAVLINADLTASRRPSCAVALASAGTRRQLTNLEIPAGAVAKTVLTQGDAGTMTLQSDEPELTYTMARQHGHWLIMQF